MHTFYVLRIGGDYEFPCKVARDFYEVFKDESGRTNVKTGWSTKNNLVIWEKLHLPCCLRFKRIKYRSEDICVSGGGCRAPNCTISISTTLPHHSDTLKVCITGYNPKVFHDEKMKRKLPPKEREVLAGKLKHQTAYALRSELADEAMTEEDFLPPHIPTMNALNKIKADNQCPEEKNAVVALYEARNVFVDCIQAIHLYPFAVYYSTPAQTAWYKKEFDRKRSIVSVDASGVGVKSPTDYPKCILLYIVCAKGTHFVLHTLYM